MGINFASFYNISIKLENGGILFCFSFYYLHINDGVCTSCLATNRLQFKNALKRFHIINNLAIVTY